MSIKMVIEFIRMDGTPVNREIHVRHLSDFRSFLDRVCVNDGIMAWIFFHKDQEKIRFHKRVNGSIANSQGRVISIEDMLASVC